MGEKGVNGVLKCEVHLISPNLLLMAEPIVEKAADVI